MLTQSANRWLHNLAREGLVWEQEQEQLEARRRPRRVWVPLLWVLQEEEEEGQELRRVQVVAEGGLL